MAKTKKTLPAPQPTIAVNLALITTRKNHLNAIKLELKTEFVGIDYIIDELIDDIEIWYLMPEILSRPVVINLWGMTGVGKTDLIRKLVSKLDFQDRFVEIELSHSDNNSWNQNVAKTLESDHVNDGKPTIILFDEIQRFNTLDDDGKPVQNTRYNDFWELLSDGRLAKRDVKDEIQDQLQRFMFSTLQRKKKNTNTEKEEPTETIGLWQAQTSKRVFGLENDVSALADMTEEELLVLIQSLNQKKKIYEPVNHSQSLIIISGNLDDAYSMAKDISEADVDADIFRAYTEKITLVDIKNALSRKFKPEQVARFGNTHLIYKSLRKIDFETLIESEIGKIKQKNLEHFGIEILISQNINQLIYQNGVFPVQGVRPVFSSMMDILEANLPKLLFEALLKNITKIAIDYDFEKAQIIGNIGNNEFEMRIGYVGKIDKIRSGNLPDVVANVSVHEAGHAVVYGCLFGIAPLQLKSKLASSYAGGFTFPHQIHQTKQNIINKMKVYLAGGLAEDLVFGEANATSGRSSDREETTKMAIAYVRKYGFDENFQACYEDSSTISIDTNITDPSIEALIKKLVSQTRELLLAQKPWLLAMSKALLEAGSLSSEAIAQQAKSFGIDLSAKEENHLIVANYQDLLAENQ